jgi:Ca2+/Na+ antiporter
MEHIVTSIGVIYWISRKNAKEMNILKGSIYLFLAKIFFMVFILGMLIIKYSYLILKYSYLIPYKLYHSFDSKCDLNSDYK